jgi:predicted metal-dependent hydrolase
MNGRNLQTGPTQDRPTAADSVCSQPLPAEVLEGLERFNRGAFFDAHESLERAWRDEPSEVRELYHGILQLAVAWHHVERGSFRGALHALERAEYWLAGFPPECQGLHVEAIRAQVDGLRQEVVRRGEAGLGAVDRGLHHPICPSDPKRNPPG